MATRKSSIGASLVIDRRQFKAALEASKGDAVAFAKSLEAIKTPRSGALSGDSWGSGIKGVIGKYQHLRSVVTDVAGLAIRTAGAPAMYNDMADSLKAVTGSAEEATQALDFIAGVAEEQKLEFEPLVAAYERMRALGYSAEQTRDLIRELGNAIETSGGDASDLTVVVSALSKIKDKGELSAKALHQMGESMPFLRTILKEQFGAETAADIEKLGLSAEELFDGIIRGLKRVETNKGGKLDAMSPEYIASMARLRAGRAGTGTNPFIPDLPDRTPDAADPAGDASRIATLRGREAAAAAEKKQKAEAEALATLEEETAISDKQLEIEKARREGDEQRIEDLEDELRIMTEVKEMVEKTGLAEDVVEKALRHRANNLRELARIEKEAGQGKFGGDAKEQMEIDRLRSRGKYKQADKLEKDRSLKNRTDQLMKEGGLSEAQAKKMAGDEQRIQEDSDYLARTGRKKMRGATNGRQSFTGLDGYNFMSDRPMGMVDEWSFDKLDAMKADRRNRPLKSTLHREAGKASIKPDATSGMSQKQADAMLEVLRAIRSATESNQPTVAQKTSSR